MKEIIDKIRNKRDCIVYPPNGKIKIENEMTLPSDLVEFYKLCGGILFYEKSGLPIEIVPPYAFTRANPIIIGEEWKEDISYSWFIVGRSENSGGQYITIDTDKKRLGQCYDSFWDKHASLNCPIIAKSFSELLERLYSSDGEEWYWDVDEFEVYGFAHDSLPYNTTIS